MSTLLRVQDLTLAIGGSVILNGVSFEINSKERVGLIGPNGSGKTSLFNLISGFHQSSSGRIIFAEQDVSTLQPHQRAKLGIGRTFQNFGIFREMTLEENIVVALENGAKNSDGQHRYQKDAVGYYLDLAKLTHKRSERAGSLSGGQMRFLEIVRCLASGAELLLLDEPTAGVSPKFKAELLALLRQVHQLGKTVIIIEHDMSFLYGVSDRIIVLDAGEIILQGDPAQVRESALLKEIYFGDANSTAVEANNRVGLLRQ